MRSEKWPTSNRTSRLRECGVHHYMFRKSVPTVAASQLSIVARLAFAELRTGKLWVGRMFSAKDNKVDNRGTRTGCSRGRESPHKQRVKFHQRQTCFAHVKATTDMPQVCKRCNPHQGKIAFYGILGQGCSICLTWSKQTKAIVPGLYNGPACKTVEIRGNLPERILSRARRAAGIC